MVEINCSQCGGKSPMGAIFCRECGAKLDLDSLKPKVKKEATGGGIKFTKLAVRRLISLAFFLLLMFGVWLLVGDDAPVVPENASANEVSLIQHVYNGIADKTERKSFPGLRGEGVTHYFAKELKESQTGQEGNFTMLMKDAIFEFYDENHIKIDLRSEVSIFSMKKNMSVQVVLTFENTPDGVVFDVKKAKHGKISLPLLKDKLVYSKLKQLVPAGDDLDTMLGKLKELKIDEDGKLRITLK